MMLSIVIPVFNEESTVRELITKVKKVSLPKGVRKEIIAVNDGSSDKSLSILRKTKGILVVNHKVNRGKGAALRSGFAKAKGDIVLIQDADLEYDPNDYPKLIEPILKNKAKVVYGTRLKNYPVRILGKNHTPFLLHFLGNKFLTFITNLLYGKKLSDMETCYKVISTEVLKSFKLKSDGFEFEPEITAKILKRGYKIHEVPIKVKPRGYNEGKKITWVHGFGALWALLKYRFTD